jgi:GntR family transcriptional regulator
MAGGVVFRFRLDGSSGVPPYLQLVHQVRQSLLLGYLRAGDRLPTVKEVAVDLAINPNTVVKAYRQLEHEGLTAGRPGQGTFITASPEPAGVQVPSAAAGKLRRSLDRWLRDAVAAGLSEQAITALIAAARRDAAATAVRAAGPAGAVAEERAG